MVENKLANLSTDELSKEIKRREDKDKSDLEKKFKETVPVGRKLLDEQLEKIADLANNFRTQYEKERMKAVQLSEKYGLPFDLYVARIANSKYTPESFMQWEGVSSDLIDSFDIDESVGEYSGWRHSEIC